MAVARIPESIRYNKIIEAAADLIGDKESTKEKMPQLQKGVQKLESLLPYMKYPLDDDVPYEKHQLIAAFTALIVGYSKMYEKEDDDGSKKSIIVKRMDYEFSYANLTKGELQISDYNEDKA